MLILKGQTSFRMSSSWDALTVPPKQDMFSVLTILYMNRGSSFGNCSSTGMTLVRAYSIASKAIPISLLLSIRHFKNWDVYQDSWNRLQPSKSHGWTTNPTPETADRLDIPTVSLCDKSHDSFHLRCRPRLNFFCGQNGSGKTAVLHGLQMCLGVSVKQSGRASTGGELIKDDANHCKTMATLWNTGRDAYMPRKYGHEVTIVREMKRTPKGGATSSWSILNASGTKVKAVRNPPHPPTQTPPPSLAKKRALLITQEALQVIARSTCEYYLA